MARLADTCTAVLGLFPGLEGTGGVQTSGRLAWQALAERFDGEAQLFCFCGPGADSNVPIAGTGVHAGSKTGAITRALRQAWPVDLVLIWHLGLLKLLPFFRTGSAKVAVCLLGVESWHQQDWLTRLLLCQVDLFLSISDYTWQRFVAANPSCAGTPHQTMHLGLDAPLQGCTPPPVQPPSALMLSRLVVGEGYKGHRQVIEGWPLVLKRLPLAELWIAGDGNLRPELEALARAHRLEGSVRFWGQVDEAQKQVLLSRSTCLLMPSRGEGFGLVYLEAMRLGRPCLVSTLDAGREVVSPPEAGLAVNPDDLVGLAEAIVQLLEPGPCWDNWSLQARQRYEHSFTAIHFQERLLAALELLRHWEQVRPAAGTSG